MTRKSGASPKVPFRFRAGSSATTGSAPAGGSRSPTRSRRKPSPRTAARASARALLTYRPDADGRYYAGYELEPDREIAGHALHGRDKGGFVLGAERRIGPSTTYFAENNHDLYGQRRALTSAYGVTYTPSSTWKYSGNFEAGRVRDDIDCDFDRTALSFGMNYDSGAGVTARARA